MRKKLLELLGLLDSSQGWVCESVAFIELKETRLLSEKAGKSTASDLLANLKIRIWTVGRAGVKALGMIELKNVLETMDSNEIVRNYAFKNDEKYLTVYVDEAQSRIIGAILIPVD